MRLQFADTIQMKRIRIRRIVRLQYFNECRVEERTGRSIRGRSYHPQDHRDGEGGRHQRFGHAPKPIRGGFARLDLRPYVRHEVRACVRVRASSPVCPKQLIEASSRLTRAFPFDGGVGSHFAKLFRVLHGLYKRRSIARTSRNPALFLGRPGSMVEHPVSRQQHNEQGR